MAPSRYPQPVNETTWYYEENRSFTFVTECRDENGVYHKTIQFKVPAKALEESLTRMPKRKASAK